MTMKQNHVGFMAALFFIAASSLQARAAQTPVLLAQTSEIAVGGFSSGGVTVPPTIIGMQFYVSIEEVGTNTPYAGGTYVKVDEARLTNALGGSLRLSKGQTGVFDFPVTNSVPFSNIVAALTNGTNDYMFVGGFGYNIDRIYTAGLRYGSPNDNGLWGLPSGPGLAGSRIDFFRLIVTSVDWGATNDGFRITGRGQWQVFGATNEPCSPHRATVTANLVNGFVVGATIVDAGCGYTNAPLVLIQGGGGAGAMATAVVSNGQVTAITINDAGCCYSNAPNIVIASPPFVPWLSISFSKVKVAQNVVLGRNYVLESSTDLINWTPTGPQFTATSETVEAEFDVDIPGRHFRIRQVP